ncbi:MAG TPA: DUF3047 domain-containing protein [Burkholderiaceae bacterium]|nr:DUF3047 domain-containing protein [Burkholderiaceae bacterium]
MKPHLMALGLGLWAAGSALAADGPNLLTDFGGAPGPAQGPWRFVGLPNQTKPMTRFRVVAHEDARVLEVKADESYGNLVHDVSGHNSNARMLSWRWRIEQDNPQGDPHKKSGDDHSLAVCAMFDLPLSSLSFGERSILRAARASTGEDVASATLCYTWDERQEAGTMLESPFTRRVRYMVLRGQGEPLQQWRSEQRDLRADFLRLFGSEASTVPPLVGVAVSADSDNTHGHSLALVGELALK